MTKGKTETVNDLSPCAGYGRNFDRGDRRSSVIPTSSHYTFSRLSNRRDITEFSLLSSDPPIRHAGPSRSGRQRRSPNSRSSIMNMLMKSR
jgi:hypothetical protein